MMERFQIPAAFQEHRQILFEISINTNENIHPEYLLMSSFFKLGRREPACSFDSNVVYIFFLFSFSFLDFFWLLDFLVVLVSDSFSSFIISRDSLLGWCSISGDLTEGFCSSLESFRVSLNVFFFSDQANFLFFLV